jgi:hypothetical protein
MTLNQVEDSYFFFFVFLCAAARGCDVHAHSKETEQGYMPKKKVKETEQGYMPYRTVGALPGQGWWQRQRRLRVWPRVYQQFFSVTKLSEPCLYIS